MTWKRRRVAPNTIASQRTANRLPFVPTLNPDVVPGPPADTIGHGAPPDVSSFAVTTFDGRQNLMRDFYYKLPLGAFQNAEPGTEMPFVVGSPVVFAETAFLYPLDNVDGFNDIGPNGPQPATPSGAGVVAAVPSFPSGFGYDTVNAASPLAFPVGFAGNPAGGNFTLQFWVRGEDWSGGATAGILRIGAIVNPNAIQFEPQTGLGDNLLVQVNTTAGVFVQIDSGVALVDNTTHFVSLTRSDDTTLLVHVDGVFVATGAIPAGSLFNFLGVNGEFAYAAGRRVNGQLGDFNLVAGALYGAADYAVPVEPLTAESFANQASWAVLVPAGFRMILRRITIAGAIEFDDDILGAPVALTSAAGPSDDFFSTSIAAPILTFNRNSVPLNDITFGNTPGISDDSTIYDLLWGPISFDLYEIFDAGDVFSIGLSQNPNAQAGRASFNVSDRTFCYLYGQIIPSDSSEVTETGLTKRPIPTIETPGGQLS